MRLYQGKSGLFYLQWEISQSDPWMITIAETPLTLSCGDLK